MTSTLQTQGPATWKKPGKGTCEFLPGLQSLGGFLVLQEWGRVFLNEADWENREGERDEREI